MVSQLLLDGMLPPLKKFDRAVKANRKLTEQETINLYQIFCDCVDEGEAFNVQAALTDIALTYGNYFKRGNHFLFYSGRSFFALRYTALNMVK